MNEEDLRGREADFIFLKGFSLLLLLEGVSTPVTVKAYERVDCTRLYAYPDGVELRVVVHAGGRWSEMSYAGRYLIGWRRTDGT